MDCEMPHLNGYEATKIIKSKAREFNKEIRILGYSAL